MILGVFENLIKIKKKSEIRGTVGNVHSMDIRKNYYGSKYAIRLLLPNSREEYFFATEKPELRPLPREKFEVRHYTNLKVGLNGGVYLVRDKYHYSVLHKGRQWLLHQGDI
jgi:hypothetical protein